MAESRWAQVFDGWVDESPLKHDEHDEQLVESGEHDGQYVMYIHSHRCGVLSSSVQLTRNVLSPTNGIEIKSGLFPFGVYVLIGLYVHLFQIQVCC